MPLPNIALLKAPDRDTELPDILLDPVGVFTQGPDATCGSIFTRVARLRRRLRECEHHFDGRFVKDREMQRLMPRAAAASTAAHRRCRPFHAIAAASTL